MAASADLSSRVVLPSVCVCVSFSVIRCNNNPPHQQWVCRKRSEYEINELLWWYFLHIVIRIACQIGKVTDFVHAKVTRYCSYLKQIELL
jgi:hypothetical protein